MSNTIDYVSEIIKFNNDPEIIALREKYSEPSFFEVISKERSETTYSAFLKWMFQDCVSGKNTISPILQLLNILVKRSREQDQDNGNTSIKELEELQTAILSGGLEITNSQVISELCISDYLSQLEDTGGKLDAEEKIKKVKKIQDKLDLFIDCEIEIKKLNYTQRLQIIIENKIGSGEGQPKDKDNCDAFEYKDVAQTERYYMATKRVDSASPVQIYVYLSPIPSYELSKYKEIGKEIKPKSQHYIHINYQDILDGIVTPLLTTNTLSPRSKFFLEEFKNQLTFPSLDSGQLSIAIGQENISQFTRLMSEKYNYLIIHSAIAYVGRTFYESNGKLVLKVPKESKSKQVEVINAPSNWTIDIKAILDKYTEVVKNTSDESIDTKETLVQFWEKNDRLLLAIMNGLQDDEKQKIEELIKLASKRQISKYKIFVHGKPITNKPVGNSKAAREIIQAWINQKFTVKDDKWLNNAEERLKILREKFGVGLNPYYGKWHPNLFQYLFYTYQQGPERNYTYDKEPNVGVLAIGGWDFDLREESKNQHIIYLDGKSKEQKIILLKVWQKSGIEKLINYIIKENDWLRVEEYVNDNKIGEWNSATQKTQ